MALSLFHSRVSEPFLEEFLNPSVNRSRDIWHIGVAGLPETFEYGYRVKRVGESDQSRFVAATLKEADGADGLYFAFNSADTEAAVTLPESSLGKRWRWAVNTAAQPPYDLFDGREKVVPSVPLQYRMLPH